MPGNVVYESIPKTRFEALIPKGDDTLGGPPVANQTDEIVRVKDKVITGLPAAGQPRFDALRQYNLNIARTGADRDGVSSLFDMRVDTRASSLHAATCRSWGGRLPKLAHCARWWNWPI